MQNYIEIDGSLFEGGGQMIRSSVALSTVLKKEFRMHSIRKNRPNPGVNNQLRSVFSAYVQKLPKVGDTEVYFYPHFRQPEIIKCTTAASCTLMLQCLVPTCVGIGYEQQIKVEGGTDVSRSPPIESIQKGLIPLMNRMGVNLHITDIKRGYYPTGNGYLQFRVDPVEYIKPIQLCEFKPPEKVQITYYQKQKELPGSHKAFLREVKALLGQHFPQTKINYNVKVHRVSRTKADYGIGCLILGEGVVWDVGTVGEKITEEQILNRIHHYAEHRVCVDEHHQDQLLLLCVLANGVSRIRSGTNLSLHTQSLFYVIKSFIPQFSYSHEEDMLTIEGIGHKCSS